VRKVLADGLVKEYRYPRDGKKPAVARISAASIDALVIDYRNSPEFERLAPHTKRLRLIRLRPLDDVGFRPVEQMRRREAIHIRDAVYRASGPAAANAFVSAARIVFEWGISRDRLENNPFDKIKALPGGALAAWTEEQASLALSKFPEHLRRVVVLAIYTGQRRGDLVALRWSQIAGGTLHITQQKGGMNVTMPMHPALATEMEAWRAEEARHHNNSSPFILLNKRRKPWKAATLTCAIKRALTNIGVSGLSIHGLRKLSANRLAEAGCTTHEIASITGHKSLGMVQHYTDKAERRRLAVTAVSRLKAIG